MRRSWLRRTIRPTRSHSPASRTTTSRTPASSAPTSCLRTSGRSGTSLPSSSTVSTTCAARCATRTTCRRPGLRPSSTSCSPATQPRSLPSPPSSSRRRTGSLRTASGDQNPLSALRWPRLGCTGRTTARGRIITDQAATGPAAERRMSIPASISMVNGLGPRDEYLRIRERDLEADIHVRGNEVTLSGSPMAVAHAAEVLTEIVTIIRTGQGLSASDVERVVGMTAEAGELRPAEVLTQNILSNRGKTIRPKTLNQKRYVDAIDAHTVVFGIGPAGTGKTYLAMAKAVAALQDKRVNRIILTRPAIEAGERLGFLPGTLNDKIDPYLRPLYDALHDMVDPDSVPRLLTAGTIEVAPLAYMRGRSLNDAFIILDEAQNTSAEQMKMFLTRLGFGSTMVVTGDVTQVDLPGGMTSGLRAARDILRGVDDIGFCELTAQDVVRHRLVSDIITAYERNEAAHAAAPQRSRTDGQKRRL